MKDKKGLLTLQMECENKLVIESLRQSSFGNYFKAYDCIIALSKLMTDQNFKELFERLAEQYKKIGLSYC